MTNLFKSAIFIVFLSLIFSFISEVLEMNLPLVNSLFDGVFYSTCFMILGMLIENIRNQLLFYDRIKNVVTAIKVVRQENSISYLAIQKIMKTIVTEFKASFNLKKTRIGIKPIHFDNNTKLPCRTCGTEHQSEIQGKCNICELPAEVWAGFTNSK